MTESSANPNPSLPLMRNEYLWAAGVVVAFVALSLALAWWIGRRPKT